MSHRLSLPILIIILVAFYIANANTCGIKLNISLTKPMLAGGIYMNKNFKVPALIFILAIAVILSTSLTAFARKKLTKENKTFCRACGDMVSG